MHLQAGEVWVNYTWWEELFGGDTLYAGYVNASNVNAASPGFSGFSGVEAVVQGNEFGLGALVPPTLVPQYSYAAEGDGTQLPSILSEQARLLVPLHHCDWRAGVRLDLKSLLPRRRMRRTMTGMVS